MGVFYLLALAAVAVAVVAAAIDAVVSVTQAQVWAQSVPTVQHLQLVETVDRRTQDLPFVGKDRRKAQVASGTLVQPLRRAS